MLYANDKEGNKITASPDILATCPGCALPVKAKCGDINIWHFSHLTGADCDTWYESESSWHKEWKEQFPVECREVVMKPHRADIKIKDLVIEVQSSPISASEIEERENFYGNMIWIVDIRDVNHNLSFYDKNTHTSFYWKHAKRSYAFANKNIYLDDGGQNLFMIMKFNGRSGYGKPVERKIFIENLQKNIQPKKDIVIEDKRPRLSIYGESWHWVRVPYKWDREGNSIAWIPEGYENWKKFYKGLSEKERMDINELFETFQINDYESW